ncbi:hypothetical protein JNE17039_46550 (plasmid) [Escherichia coli]
MSNELEIHTVYWTPDKKSDQQIFLPEGLYAYFRFKGNVNSYIRHINNAYMNILPFYGLQKRDDYDIEIISNDNECFLFEYYLPVPPIIIKNDNFNLPRTQSKMYNSLF